MLFSIDIDIYCCITAKCLQPRQYFDSPSACSYTHLHGYLYTAASSLEDNATVISNYNNICFIITEVFKSNSNSCILINKWLLLLLSVVSSNHLFVDAIMHREIFIVAARLAWIIISRVYFSVWCALVSLSKEMKMVASIKSWRF